MDAVYQVHAESLLSYTEMMDRACVLENVQLNLHPNHPEPDDDGPNHYVSQEGRAVPDFTTQTWHCTSFPACSSERTGFEVLLCDGRFAHLASASHDAVLRVLYLSP